MRNPTILLGVLALSGCVGPELKPLDNVRVYETWPTCEYESLGVVEAQDGHRGRAEGSMWALAGRESFALAKLQHAAHERGGDAVVLTLRTRQQRESDAGSAYKRSARQIKLKGVAIRDCGQPTVGLAESKQTE